MIKKKKIVIKSTSEDKNQPGINFIRNIIDQDLNNNAFDGRKWSGRPKPFRDQCDAKPDTTSVRTRFPPEPNGYLHLGHAKSICLNFGIAKDYDGACHLRFDDTNPVTENEEYVQAIKESVKWLGFDWEELMFFSSDYFEYLYDFALEFIKKGDAYVDSLDSDEIRRCRGTLTEKGIDSPFRIRSVKENLEIFENMRLGKFKEGSHVLRLKIDMEAPNLNLRDPVIYRILHKTHHKTGRRWCIYPMYDYTHCISDALENITHSLCTLEFEDHRVLYDWILNKLMKYGILKAPVPRQYEFSRLNLSHVVLSKRKLIQLVEEGHVDGWDDPRMPTLVGAKRRGYPSSGIKKFCDRIGISKSDSIIDYTIFEDCAREELNDSCQRRFAILDPLKLVIENYPNNSIEHCIAGNHPKLPQLGTREIPFTKEIWIEKSDFVITPPKGFFRLYPGNKVRLRFGYVIECLGYDVDEVGKPNTIYCRYFSESKSGSLKSNYHKVKGNIHWLSMQHAIPCTINLFDRLFLSADPSKIENLLEHLNPHSKKTTKAFIEPSLKSAQIGDQFQFERHGYFILDAINDNKNSFVFNRTVTLRDTWAKDRKRK